jgi:integrase
MSSRAITSDMIRKIYTYNQAEGRCDVAQYSGSTSRLRAEYDWGSPRKRLLVHTVMTIAFVCLMRIDEVLNLKFEDIKLKQDYGDGNCISITLETRKTHQYGGE